MCNKRDLSDLSDLSELSDLCKKSPSRTKKNFRLMAEM